MHRLGSETVALAQTKVNLVVLSVNSFCRFYIYTHDDPTLALRGAPQTLSAVSDPGPFTKNARSRRTGRSERLPATSDLAAAASRRRSGVAARQRNSVERVLCGSKPGPKPGQPLPGKFRAVRTPFSEFLAGNRLQYPRRPHRRSPANYFQFRTARTSGNANTE